MEPTFAFESELTPWEATSATWVFATVPKDDSEEICEIVPHRRGFGSVRVRVELDGIQWATSIFPDSKSGCFVLPLKKQVRTKAGVDIGDVVELEITLLLD